LDVEPNHPSQGLWHHRVMNKLQDTPHIGFTLKFTVSGHKIEGNKNIMIIRISFKAKILIKI
jgi:hypothetical protein